MKATNLVYVCLAILCMGNTLNVQQAEKNITIRGVLWDGDTGEEIPTTLIAYTNTGQRLVSKTIKTKKFKTNIPINTIEIEFISEGYQSIKVPVTFHGEFTKKALADIEIPTFKKDSAFTMEDLVFFCYPSDYKVDRKYEWYDLKPEGYDLSASFGNTFRLYKASTSFSKSFGFSSRGKLVIKNSASEVETTTYEITKGMNFIDTNAYSFADEDRGSNELNITDQTIYFPQSEYTLSNTAKISLDELADYMKANPEAMISIKGFTDTIGDMRLNTILAQYRAKVTSSYLRESGVSEDRIKLTWETPVTNRLTPLREVNEDQLLFLRKVEIREIKK